MNILISRGIMEKPIASTGITYRMEKVLIVGLKIHKTTKVLSRTLPICLNCQIIEEVERFVYPDIVVPPPVHLSVFCQKSTKATSANAFYFVLYGTRS